MFGPYISKDVSWTQSRIFPRYYMVTQHRPARLSFSRCVLRNLQVFWVFSTLKTPKSRGARKSNFWRKNPCLVHISRRMRRGHKIVFFLDTTWSPNIAPRGWYYIFPRQKIIASLRHGLCQNCFGAFCGFQHILTPNFRKHVFSHRFLPNKRCDTFPRAENDILACFRGQDSTLKKFGNFAFQDRFSKRSHFRQDRSRKCVLGHITILTPYIEIPI